MKIRVCDTETSNLPEDGGRICEIAWYDADIATMALIPGSGRSYLVNPCMPIPPEVRAVHHIDPRELVGRPVPGWAVAELLDGLEPGDLLAAHVAKFESALIDAPGIAWLDTWKIALRAWPANKSHGNSALRYFLGVDEKPGFDLALAMPPHRAAPDAYVTAWVLCEQLALGRPIERLLEISAEPALLSICKMTKHKGVPYRDVAERDPSYLTWVIDKSDLDADTKFSAGYWLQRAKEKAGAKEAGPS